MSTNPPVARRWLPGMLLTLGGLGLGGVLVMAARPRGNSALASAPAPEVASPARVSALGRLMPVTEIIEVGGVSGSRVAKLCIREGQQVRKGDVLAILDEQPVRQAMRDRAAARLSEARSLRENAIQLATLELEEAKLSEARLKEVNPFEIAAQEATVKRLEVDLATAERQLVRLQGLKSVNLIPEVDLDDQSRLVESRKQELTASRYTLNRLTAAFAQDTKAFAVQVRTAEMKLKKAEVDSYVDSLQGELAVAQAELDRSMVCAPAAGTILDVLSHPGERIDKEPILRMGGTDEMVALAEVYETDARFVRPGQRAEVTSAALAGPVAGVVERVGQIVLKNQVVDIDPASQLDARVVKVWIRLEDSATARPFNRLQVRVLIRVDADRGGAAQTSGPPVR